MTSQPLSNFWRGGGRRPGVRSRAARKGQRLRENRRPSSPTKVQRYAIEQRSLPSPPPLQFLERGWPKAGGEVARSAKASACAKTPTRLPDDVQRSAIERRS